jgi:hypothetical protein
MVQLAMWPAITRKATKTLPRKMIAEAEQLAQRGKAKQVAA